MITSGTHGRCSFSATSDGSESIAQGQQDVHPLVHGQTIERELASGETHSYQITLAAGQYLHVVVDQRSYDLVVTLFGPDGQQINQYDGRWHGPESVSLITEASGAYRLVIRTLQLKAARGPYKVKIEELRAPAPQDQSRIAAERAATEGKKLLSQDNEQTLRQAKEKYETALPLWREAKDRFGEAQTLNSLGYIYGRLSEPQVALDHYNQALTLRRAIKDLYGEAETLLNIAAAHSALGEKEKALDDYLQAIPPMRATRNPAGVASILNNVGVTYFSLGELQKTLEYYREALTLWRAADDPAGQARTLGSLGATYSLLGEYQQALDHYIQALAQSRAARDQRGTAYTLHNLGKFYYDLGEKERALDHYAQALPYWQAVGDLRGKATTLQNLGAAYTAQGEHQKALDHHDQALQLFRAVRDRYGEAYTLTNLGRAYYELGDKQKALDHYHQALPLNRTTGNRRGEGVALYNIGAAYFSLGKKDEALASYNQALRAFRDVGDRSAEAATLYNIARVERDRDNLAEARTQIEGALKIIEALRIGVASQELRASYFASIQDYYKFYIDLMMQLDQLYPAAGHDALALEAAERARARSLVELLAESRADIRQGIDAALLDRERSLQQRINARQFQLDRSNPTKEQAEAAKKELEGLIAELQQTVPQIRQASPHYAALKYPTPLSLAEIQQMLDRDTLLLEYALGEERSYLWAVTPTSITSFALPKRAEIEAAAKRAYELLTARNRQIPDETDAQKIARWREADAQYPEIAVTLSRMLLEPVSAQLGKKRLLIVADGALQYLPFAALPKPESERKANPQSAIRNPQLFTPLVAEHEIVSLPSASTLAVSRRELAGRAPAPKLVAILADPVFEPDDVRLKRSGREAAALTSNLTAPSSNRQAMIRSAAGVGATDEQQRLQRLSFSRREAEAIIALASGQTTFKALDFDANRAAAINPALGEHRIIHLATHGLLNSQHPELSGIVLSLVDRRGQPQDGFLRLHDIYNLKLNADLVVLSACQTALGKEVRGEGLVGLTRGFMYAGGARVVGSLWKVDDRATAELMKHFYRRMLVEKMRPAAALREAQAAIRKERRWQSPHYWAGFVLQGEWK